MCPQHHAARRGKASLAQISAFPEVSAHFADIVSEFPEVFRVAHCRLGAERAVGGPDYCIISGSSEVSGAERRIQALPRHLRVADRPIISEQNEVFVADWPFQLPHGMSPLRHEWFVSGFPEVTVAFCENPSGHPEVCGADRAIASGKPDISAPHHRSTDGMSTSSGQKRLNASGFPDISTAWPAVVPSQRRLAVRKGRLTSEHSEVSVAHRRLDLRSCDSDGRKWQIASGFPNVSAPSLRLRVSPCTSRKAGRRSPTRRASARRVDCPASARRNTMSYRATPSSAHPGRPLNLDAAPHERTEARPPHPVSRQRA